MLASYYLKRRDVSELLSVTPDVSELLLNFDFFIIAHVIPLMKYCCYYGHQCGGHTSRNKVITRLVQGSRLIPVLAQTPGRDLSHTKGSVQRPKLNL